MIPSDSAMPGRAVASAGRGRVALVKRLASLKLTLVLLVMLGVCLLLAYGNPQLRTWPLVPPLLALSANLLAAVATNGVFRTQLPLLLFHLALAALVLLVAAGRLTYLKGTLELVEGGVFEGRLSSTDAGPLHSGALSAVRFANEGFSIDYAVGVQRGPTSNRVSWTDDDGRPRTELIGDQKPLELRGYRFYTSPNKGFAPIFLWQPADGTPPELGAVHLPSYPINDYRQSNTWTLPGTAREVWILLQFDELILDPARPSVFRLPEVYELVVRSGDLRQVLKPGETITLPEGTLRFEGMRSWMGYNVFYDWTLPWLAAASVLAVLSLGWHFWRKFAAKPWDA